MRRTVGPSSSSSRRKRTRSEYGDDRGPGYGDNSPPPYSTPEYDNRAPGYGYYSPPPHSTPEYDPAYANSLQTPRQQTTPTLRPQSYASREYTPQVAQTYATVVHEHVELEGHHSYCPHLPSFQQGSAAGTIRDGKAILAPSNPYAQATASWEYPPQVAETNATVVHEHVESEGHHSYRPHLLSFQQGSAAGTIRDGKDFSVIKPVVISSSKMFDGYNMRYKHYSPTLGCSMTFHIYFPFLPSSSHKFAVLYWLSGLTCTDEDFISKSGAQRVALSEGIALIAPDTSPRGLNVEGETDIFEGAGFYLNATQDKWKNWQMYDYVVEELPKLLSEYFPQLDTARASIFGHSIGGHGALTIYLKNLDKYKSVSAFSPVVNPLNCPWGQKAFTNYLGANKADWEGYDPTCLMGQMPILNDVRATILIDQGEEDEFPHKFEAACRKAQFPLWLRFQRNHGPSYSFIATFIEDHIIHHARVLNLREDPSVTFSHGKKVYTDYSITGIPGDGRCLFRSVAHDARLRSGKPAPNESLERKLAADDSRARSVAVGGLQNRCSNRREDPSVTSSHGKKVYTDYSVTGIRGDGRCLFRAVAHGAHLRSGKPAPDESLEMKLADDLRARVADEFVKRRTEKDWFLGEDFDIHVSQMRKPNVWGGEHELLMASHVLQMPITVFVPGRDSRGLIAIADYGQEYGEDPIKVLYDGSSHYDLLQIPGKDGIDER